MSSTSCLTAEEFDGKTAPKEKLSAPNWFMTPSGRMELEAEKPVSLPDNGTPVWIHLTSSSEKDLQLMLQNFKIHYLTIEDMLHAQSRIKMENFHHYTFFTFRGLQMENNHIHSNNFHFVLLKNQLITVTKGFRYTIFDLIRDWPKFQNLLVRGPEYILHHILDAETDKTIAIVREMEDQVDEFEQQIMVRNEKIDIKTVFEMRSNLQHIKRVMNHHKDILDELDKQQVKFYIMELEAFFHDVRDHQIRILETVDQLIASISFVLEVHLTQTSKHTSDIMRYLTVLTAIMLPMSIITGFYGMNFKIMPGLDNPIGYVFTIGCMVILGVVMFLYFRSKHWF